MTSPKLHRARAGLYYLGNTGILLEKRSEGWCVIDFDGKVEYCKPTKKECVKYIEDWII